MRAGVTMLQLFGPKPGKTSHFRSRGLRPVALLITLGLCLCLSIAGRSSAQAQLLNLSANATIKLPVIGGTTSVSVPVNVLGNTVNLNVNVTGVAGGITLLPVNVTVPVTVNGRTIDVALNVAPGTIPVVGGQTTITVPIALTLPPIVLTSALNTTGALVTARRNDALLGLDLGLDRQIDILAGPSNDTSSVWSEPMALGGMRLAGIASDTLAGANGRNLFEGEQMSFATSLQQMRQSSAAASPPYGLGAGSRPPPPARSPFDIWAEGSFAWFEEGSGSAERRGHWGVLFVGADYRLSPNVLIGTLVQFDSSSQKFTGGTDSAHNTGWMAGPYATVRLSDHWYFQARAAWGKSNVELGFGGLVEDHFDAERWLVRGTLLGQWRAGPWQLRPRISIGYIEEQQDSYLSAFGVVVPGQTLALGQVKAGPEIAYRYRLADGTVIEPNLVLEGIWNFLQDGGAASIIDDQVFGERLRGRAETGLMVQTRGGVGFGASVSYDGIGASDYQSVAGKLRLRVPLN
jgi:hypothetical protein